MRYRHLGSDLKLEETCLLLTDSGSLHCWQNIDPILMAGEKGVLLTHNALHKQEKYAY